MFTVLSIFTLGVSVSAAVPHGHACLPPYDTFPFCDTTKSIAARVQNLISLLDDSTKAGMLYDLSPAVASLGLTTFNWNQEGLHGLGAHCLTVGGVTKCPTIFPAPPTLGASFNRSLLHAAGDVISTEARVYNNNGGTRSYQNRPVDLNIWLPNLNIGRDPRWGRSCETYSEDPIVIGTLGAQIIDGAMHGNDGASAPYLKMIVAAKHGTAYQTESNRFGFNDLVTAHDIAATYLPAWELAARCDVPGAGCVTGYMCAYPALNSVPLCASAWFSGLMRQWGMGSDPAHAGGSYIQGDCGALDDISDRHHWNNVTKVQAMAYVLNQATADIDCGGALPGNALPAVAAGLTTMASVEASLARTLTLQFLAGRFDPLQAQPYTALPFEAVDAPASLALANEGAQQGMVLLRNDAGLLPLTPGARLACIGPHCNTTIDLMGNYFEQRCASGDFACVPTVSAGLAAYNGAGGSVTTVVGCAVNDATHNNIPAAVAAASAADVVVLAIGMDQRSAGEGSDRVDMSLPGGQVALATAILALGKPTVVLVFAGQAVGLDAVQGLFASARAAATAAAPLALIYAFYPGEGGGMPVAEQLYGGVNRWGKLPISLYPNSYATHMPVTDMGMLPNASTGNVGRTYKYYSGPLLYPFGFGLSYTTFALSGSCNVSALQPLPEGSGLQCTVNVTNSGPREGDEVVLVFTGPNATTVAAARQQYSLPDPDPVAIKQVVDFERVSLQAGQSTLLTFQLPFSHLAQVDAQGNRVVYAGQHLVRLGRGVGNQDDVVVPVHIARTVLVRKAYDMGL